MICVAGGRYEKVENGLRIHNVTPDDQGEYICRADIETDGRYDERRITVVVRGKFQGRVQDFSLEGAGQDTINQSIKFIISVAHCRLDFTINSRKKYKSNVKCQYNKNNNSR